MQRIIQLSSFCFLILASILLKAQDIHFSQFYNSPLNLSPGLTGNFVGDIRVVGNQRSQWSSVTTPYSTFGLAIDANTIYNTPVSVGLGFYNDKAGDSEYSTLQIAPSVGYTYFIGDSTHTLTAGIQPTFTQKSINYDKLKFDNQYNGISYDESLSNGETFSNDGRSYLNVHGGLSWNYNIGQRKSVTAGVALHNIFNPKQSFFNNNAIELHRRFTFHANGLFKISDRIDGLPGLSIMTQDQFKEIIFGGSGKYHLNNGNYKAAYLGFWYRNSDATYITAEMDYGSFHFGVSYDINLSSLKVASKNRGGFEFAIIYIFEKYRPTIKRYKACPNYI
ncbi:MAG: PorP/SprF family type IX secretion system membrane protein [Bacteroidetes bacterium]|nr:PorP/SprF family type IX secretion system membrane protein [Bacteroidota bacterium]